MKVNWISLNYGYGTYTKNGYSSFLEKNIIPKINQQEINIVYKNFGDFNLKIPGCYVVQANAFDNFDIAWPYNDKEHVVNLLRNYTDKEEIFDLSFVGRRTSSTKRENFISYIQEKFKDKRLLIKYRNNYYHSRKIDFEKKKDMDKDLLFQKSLINSRLVLAPEGASGQSLRFYECMQCERIPVFFGNRNLKLPLDWLIDWKKLVPIVYYEDIENNNGRNIISEWLEKSDIELSECRKKCKQIFDDLLKKNFKIEVERYLVDKKFIKI